MDLAIRYAHKNSHYSIQIINPMINKIKETIFRDSPHIKSSETGYYFGRAITIAFSFGKIKNEEQKTKNVTNGDIKKDDKL